jgi:hypothetical protein
MRFGGQSIRFTLLLAFGLVALSLPAPTARAGDGTEIVVGAPQRSGDEITLELTIAEMFDTEIGEALESGLPVTYAIGWTLWRARPSWWDRKLDNGERRYRVFFDVLEEHYDLFDHTGRHTATCGSLDEVEDLLCGSRTLSIPTPSRLAPRHRYYMAVEIRIESLDVEEIRDLEEWLGGDEDAADASGALSALSDDAIELLKSIAGLGGQSLRGRSPLFRGWVTSP